METLRFGIVGTGTIAHRFAQAIRRQIGVVYPQDRTDDRNGRNQQ